MYRADWTYLEELEVMLENVSAYDKAKSSGEPLRMGFSERIQLISNPQDSIRDRVMQRAGEKAQKDWDNGMAVIQLRRRNEEK